MGGTYDSRERSYISFFPKVMGLIGMSRSSSLSSGESGEWMGVSPS